MTEFATLSLSSIAVSLTNPRKNFNAAKLTELAESIKASGVHQPILLRPLPGYRVTDTMREIQYEIVAGERRYRASEQAGVPTIPAMIRALTDDQVLEIQIVENLQRTDLTELEEAEGYQALMEHAQINADQVGEKIGKSRSYVYGRLKLLDLSYECKQAMREGHIDASRALLIARIPDSTLQSRALQEAMHKNGQGDVMSVRSLQTWLQQNVMLRLENASFKITDARLVEAAGSCKDCPKRTGANPDLFVDVSSADICTDPACFHGKEDAHRNALIARAAKKGMRFIEGTEAKELIAHQYTQRIDGYTPLSQVREDITHDGVPGLSMRELLGDEAPGAVLIENPYTKELVEAVPTDEAEAVLLAKGLLTKDMFKETKLSVKQLEQELTYLQRRFDGEQQSAIDTALDVATTEAVLATSDDAAKKLLGSDFLRAWLLYLMDENHASFMARVLGYTFQENEDETDALIQHIRASSYATLSRAAVLCVMNEESRYDDALLVRNHLAAFLDVPVKAITAKATKAIKADYTDHVREIQAKIDAQKVPVPTTPLAPPEGTRGQEPEGQGVKGSKGAKPRAAKVKLSAEEAISGIAAAIQDEERATTASPEAQQVEQAGADPLYAQALALIIQEQKASKRLFKESLRIGQTKALQLLDQLEQAGKVSACDERGARKVLVAA